MPKTESFLNWVPSRLEDTSYIDIQFIFWDFIISVYIQYIYTVYMQAKR